MAERARASSDLQEAWEATGRDMLEIARAAGLELEAALEHGDGVKIATTVADAARQITGAALRGAVEHAHAGRVRVIWRPEAGVLVVAVADDGQGSDPARAKAWVREVRTRAESLGGALEVNATGGWGTQLTARLPLQPARPARALSR